MSRVLLLSFIFFVCFMQLTNSYSDEVSSSGPIEFMEVTIAELVSNPSERNGERVTLEGFVDKVEYTRSSKGEPFTLFRLNDGTDNEVRVYFEDEHLPFSKGDKVRIQGRYKKQKNIFSIK